MIVINIIVIIVIVIIMIELLSCLSINQTRLFKRITDANVFPTFNSTKKDMAFQQNVLEKMHPNCKRQKLQQSDWNSAHCNELWAFAKATTYSKWTRLQKKNRNTVRWQNLTGTKAYVPYRITHTLMRDNAVKIVIAVTVAIVITCSASSAPSA